MISVSPRPRSRGPTRINRSWRDKKKQLEGPLAHVMFLKSRGKNLIKPVQGAGSSERRPECKIPTSKKVNLVKFFDLVPFSSESLSWIKSSKTQHNAQKDGDSDSFGEESPDESEKFQAAFAMFSCCCSNRD